MRVMLGSCTDKDLIFMRDIFSSKTTPAGAATCDQGTAVIPWMPRTRTFCAWRSQYERTFTGYRHGYDANVSSTRQSYIIRASAHPDAVAENVISNT